MDGNEMCKHCKKALYEKEGGADKNAFSGLKTHDTGKDNFTVLEYRSLKRNVGISFSLRKSNGNYRIYISELCRDALGDPEYIVFSMSGDKKKLKIDAAKQDTANAVKLTARKGGAEIYSSYLGRQIEPYGNYGVVCQSCPDTHSVMFDLAKR